jgi:hypothetical protein
LDVNFIYINKKTKKKRKTKMKRIFSITLALLTLVSLLCFVAPAEDADTVSAEVYVTIADKGALVMTRELITATDRNADGVISIDEALFAAHEAKYAGGAAAGYAVAESQWGVSLTMLWGDTSGSFGYYLNHASAMSLSDPVKAGDTVCAYIYSDAVTWSDVYSYFDVDAANCEQGDSVTLKLLSAGFDADWNPVTLPVANATITVNGSLTAYKTDAEGKVTLTLDAAGVAVISAESESMTLVPPVCIVRVEAGEETTDEISSETAPIKTDSDADPTDGCRSAVSLSLITVALTALSTVVLLKHKKNEE